MVPSQIVSFIDARFPFAKDQCAGTNLQGGNLSAKDAAAAVGYLLRLIESLPDRLLRFSGSDHAEYGQALEAVRLAHANWMQGVQHYLGNVAGMPGWHPLSLLRKHLAGLPDEAADARVDPLPFVTDPELKASLRVDIEGVNSALDHGEWKNASIMAGAVVEALLLDALLSKAASDPAAWTAAEGKIGGKCKGRALEEWDLHHLTLVAEELGLIEPDTKSSCHLAKNFRNLIHPGRALRLSQTCDRGTALSAVAAMEHVMRDLK
jgi:hypothetical protein